MNKQNLKIRNNIEEHYSNVISKIDIIIEKLISSNQSNPNDLNNRRNILLGLIKSKKENDLKKLKLSNDLIFIEIEPFFIDGYCHFIKIIQTCFPVNQWIIGKITEEIDKRRYSSNPNCFCSKTNFNPTIKDIFYLQLIVTVLIPQWFNNDIVNIDTVMLEKMETISISYEDLTNFPIELPQFISEMNMKNLTKIEISKTKFTKLPKQSFEGLEFLEEIYLKESELNSLMPDSFQGLNRLKILSLRSNKLTKLEQNLFDGLVELRELDLGMNKIQTIEMGSFSKLNQLRILNLECNKLGLIKNYFFDGIEKLTELNLSGCSVYCIEEGSFNRLNYLDLLKLSNNKISSIEEKIFNDLKINRLDLSGNGIFNIKNDAFCGCSNLQQLFLSANYLKQVEPQVFESLVSLKELWLMYNPVKSIDSKLYQILNKGVQIYTDFQ